MKCGGTADAAPADEETQKVIDTVRDFQEKTIYVPAYLFVLKSFMLLIINK